MTFKVLNDQELANKEMWQIFLPAMVRPAKFCATVTCRVIYIFSYLSIGNNSQLLSI